MSSSFQAAQRLMDGHHSTLHAFFLAAKESGFTEFELQLVASPKGRIELCISPREHSEMSAKFEVRGNTVRAAPSEASVVPVDDADVRIEYGGTRSGEEPVRVSPGTRRSSPQSSVRRKEHLVPSPPRSVRRFSRQIHLQYCSSLTCSIQSTVLSSNAS